MSEKNEERLERELCASQEKVHELEAISVVYHEEARDSMSSLLRYNRTLSDRAVLAEYTEDVLTDCTVLEYIETLRGKEPKKAFERRLANRIVRYRELHKDAEKS